MAKSSPFNSTHFDQDWTMHPFIEWLSSHKKFVLWIFLALLACLFLAYRLAVMRTLQAEKDFFQAQMAFNQFQQQSVSSQESALVSPDWEELKAIMQRHPELKPKYEGPLAQTLLIVGHPAEAQPLMEDIFQRTDADQLQLYRAYSQASLAITAERYEEALAQTQALQKILEQLNEKAPSFLYVFNLMRLGMLYQQTGDAQAERKIWDQLQNQSQRVEAVLATTQALKIGEASLSQYIEERKKALQP